MAINKVRIEETGNEYEMSGNKLSMEFIEYDDTLTLKDLYNKKLEIDPREEYPVLISFGNDFLNETRGTFIVTVNLLTGDNGINIIRMCAMNVRNGNTYFANDTEKQISQLLLSDYLSDAYLISANKNYVHKTMGNVVAQYTTYEDVVDEMDEDGCYTFNFQGDVVDIRHPIHLYNKTKGKTYTIQFLPTVEDGNLKYYGAVTEDVANTVGDLSMLNVESYYLGGVIDNDTNFLKIYIDGVDADNDFIQNDEYEISYVRAYISPDISN